MVWDPTLRISVKILQYFLHPGKGLPEQVPPLRAGRIMPPFQEHPIWLGEVFVKFGRHPHRRCTYRCAISVRDERGRVYSGWIYLRGRSENWEMAWNRVVPKKLGANRVGGLLQWFCSPMCLEIACDEWSSRFMIYLQEHWRIVWSSINWGTSWD